VTLQLVLGTRGSPLALWQARHIAGRLREAHPDLEVEERIIRTEGDTAPIRPLEAGDRGIFVKRIEQAMIAGEIDIAVHSLKDLPTRQPDGLRLAAIPRRHDPRDVLLTIDGVGLDGLRPGARVGTGSPRRRTQLLALRADLEMVAVRGNVDTRVRRLLAGDLDGLVLALAGIERLGIDHVGRVTLDVARCLPAVGQGALAVEARCDDEATIARVACLEHAATRSAVEAERAFLRRLGGGCLAPASCFARLEGERIRLDAFVGDLRGQRSLRDGDWGPIDRGRQLAEGLAARMLSAGAEALLAAARVGDDG